MRRATPFSVKRGGDLSNHTNPGDITSCYFGFKETVVWVSFFVVCF